MLTVYNYIVGSTVKQFKLYKCTSERNVIQYGTCELFSTSNASLIYQTDFRVGFHIYVNY